MAVMSFFSPSSHCEQWFDIDFLLHGSSISMMNSNCTLMVWKCGSSSVLGNHTVCRLLKHIGPGEHLIAVIILVTMTVPHWQLMVVG
jgi:hypothetical protein